MMIKDADKKREQISLYDKLTYRTTSKDGYARYIGKVRVDMKAEAAFACIFPFHVKIRRVSFLQKVWCWSLAPALTLCTA